MTTRPPRVLSPSRMNFSTVPGVVSPNASYVSASLVVKQSCSSTTGRSAGSTPASSYTPAAAAAVMS